MFTYTLLATAAALAALVVIAACVVAAMWAAWATTWVWVAGKRWLGYPAKTPREYGAWDFFGERP